MRLCGRRLSSSLSFASGLDPMKLSKAHPVTLSNFVDGAWSNTGFFGRVVEKVFSFSPHGSAHYHDVVDPLNGETFIRMPRTSVAELDPFVASLKRVPKSGLHNPFKNPERFVQWGEGEKISLFFCSLFFLFCGSVLVSGRAAERLARPEVAHHFALCIQARDEREDISWFSKEKIAAACHAQELCGSDEGCVLLLSLLLCRGSKSIGV